MLGVELIESRWLKRIPPFLCARAYGSIRRPDSGTRQKGEATWSQDRLASQNFFKHDFGAKVRLQAYVQAPVATRVQSGAVLVAWPC